MGRRSLKKLRVYGLEESGADDKERAKAGAKQCRGDIKQGKRKNWMNILKMKKKKTAKNGGKN